MFKSNSEGKGRASLSELDLTVLHISGAGGAYKRLLLGGASTMGLAL